MNCIVTLIGDDNFLRNGILRLLVSSLSSFETVRAMETASRWKLRTRLIAGSRYRIPRSYQRWIITISLALRSFEPQRLLFVHFIGYQVSQRKPATVYFRYGTKQRHAFFVRLLVPSRTCVNMRTQFDAVIAHGFTSRSQYRACRWRASPRTCKKRQIIALGHVNEAWKMYWRKRKHGKLVKLSLADALNSHAKSIWSARRSAIIPWPLKLRLCAISTSCAYDSVLLHRGIKRY
jgi:hypothetical protein